MHVYLNFGPLRSFVFAFFNLAWLKSEMELNNCERSPLAAGGGGGADFEAGDGGGGGGGGGGDEVTGARD